MVFDILWYKIPVEFYMKMRLQRGVHMDLNQFHNFGLLVLFLVLNQFFKFA